MNTNADHKKRLVNPKGYTMDIVNAVLDCYDKNRQTVPSELIYLCSECDDDRELCDFIFNWVNENIEYKVDPSGEQWIKTPARLIDDGVGDCKSFSILICSILTTFGIKNMFRFVAYKGKDYQHVYPVAIIEDREFPIDVVAYKQRGVGIGEEIKYRKKYDRMNSTKISELSGIDNMSVKITSDMSVAELVAESCAMVAMAQLSTTMYNKYKILRAIISKYQSNLDNLRLACYGFLRLGVWDNANTYYPAEGTSSYNVFMQNVDSFVKAQNNPNSGYAIEDDVINAPEVSTEMKWLETNVYPFAGKYKQDSEIVTLANDLLSVGLNGLYLFIPDSYLSATQKQKKKNQNTFIEMLCGNSAFTEYSAKNFVYAGFLSQYKITPQDLFNRMFKKDVNSSYRSYLAGEDDDYCGQIEYNPNYNSYEVVTKAEVVNDDSTLSSKIGVWIEKATGWFTSIWKTVTGGTDNNTYKKITPSYDDGGGVMGWALLAVAVVIGGILLKKKKSRR